MTKDQRYSNTAFGGPWVQAVQRRERVQRILSALKQAVDDCQDRPPDAAAEAALAELEAMGLKRLANRFRNAMSSPFWQVRMVDAISAYAAIERHLTGNG